ncbi:MAG TPA: spore germination protein GerW family protein [Pirellulales bacterium]|nr:spore germination protein GerW family protein [Pirellulales bacterium]
MTSKESPDSPTLVERLAERLGAAACAKTVFAEPIECDGVTVIPVAKVRGGFGAGSGTRDDGSSGGGGGGGLAASPLGYIEIKQGETRFRRIFDPASLVPVIVASGAVGLLLLRAISKFTRR